MRIPVGNHFLSIEKPNNVWFTAKVTYDKMDARRLFGFQRCSTLFYITDYIDIRNIQYFRLDTSCMEFTLTLFSFFFGWGWVLAVLSCMYRSNLPHDFLYDWLSHCTWGYEPDYPILPWVVGGEKNRLPRRGYRYLCQNGTTCNRSILSLLCLLQNTLLLCNMELSSRHKLHGIHAHALFFFLWMGMSPRSAELHVPIKLTTWFLIWLT